MRDTRRAPALLDWYDTHARELPWRVSPTAHAAGTQPDPYRIWLSEIMLQQTTVAAVTSYFNRFVGLWPRVQDLAGAEDAAVMGEWAGLGYYARARNLLKCAREITSSHGGTFPDRYDALIDLPGIGPYTAAAISSIAFGRPETVVDGNVERVIARIYAIETPLPAAKPEIKIKAGHLTPKTRPGDYAQAVMDLGATICTPKSPACGICPWMQGCAARERGDPQTFPHKTPKAAKPVRHGFVYVVQREDGAWLLETRPPKGLLGGMLGWPTSEWGEAPADTPPLNAEWISANAEVRHTFTHFHLRLQLRVARVTSAAPLRAAFVPADQFRPSDLPTVMRKAFDLASPLLTQD